MDYQELITALIGVAVLAITAYVIPWIKAKAGAVTYARAEKYAATAVAAAKQISGLDTNEKMKEYALQFLIARGVDAELADTLIEAAVSVQKAASTTTEGV